MGQGQPLLLVHGFSHTRHLWHEASVVESLASDYRVIALDLRGCGESDSYLEPEKYTVTAYLEDIEAVLSACDVDTYLYWGWSYGATIGCHLAAMDSRLQRAVICGSYFGRIFNDDYLDNWLEDLDEYAAAKSTGDFEGFSEREIHYIQTQDFEVLKARVEGHRTWPAIQPIDILCPMLVYTGTEDGNVVVQLRKQRPEIEAAGLKLHIFEGLNHGGLIKTTDTVLPLVTDFLQG